MVQDDAALRTGLRAFSRERPRWGYRQAHQRLLEQGWSINRKRTQRLWREEGLRVPPKRRKRRRRGDSTVPGDRLRAERPDHVWAFDFQFDVTEDGLAVKLLYVVDEFTREALAMEAERRIDGDKVVDVLDRIIAEQGRRPELVRCDNGPEMTSHAQLRTATLAPHQVSASRHQPCERDPQLPLRATRGRDDVACQIVGLDPGLGIFHTDKRSRDSLVFDLMEAVRPAVDAYVLALISERVLSRADFVETPQGGCRLLPTLARELATTLPSWRQAIAPFVEDAARTLAEGTAA
ncbi:MAG: hypothetical protein NVSMB25_10020 [Thermoleophilaceae bacterium]